MKLSECIRGSIVKTKPNVTFNDICKIGHIVGLGLNCNEEIIIKVSWASDFDIADPIPDEDIGFIHPCNIELLKD